MILIKLFFAEVCFKINCSALKIDHSDLLYFIQAIIRSLLKYLLFPNSHPKPSISNFLSISGPSPEALPSNMIFLVTLKTDRVLFDFRTSSDSSVESARCVRKFTDKILPRMCSMLELKFRSTSFLMQVCTGFRNDDS